MDAEKLDRIISEFGEILGEFSEHAVIGGGVALLIYRNYLTGSRNPQFLEAAATDDIDLLVPRAILATRESLGDRLSQFGFQRLERSLEIPPVESYVGIVAGKEIAIEFLTHRRARSRADANVRVAGVSAQPLSYVEMSLESPTQITLRSGNILNIVSPAAWIFHKALTFPKRHSKEKRAKDLYGIWYVGSQLGDLSETALIDLKRLSKLQVASWRKRARSNIANWIFEASVNDWKMLERQDPTGVLTVASFRRFVDEDFPL